VTNSSGTQATISHGYPPGRGVTMHFTRVVPLSTTHVASIRFVCAKTWFKIRPHRALTERLALSFTIASPSKTKNVHTLKFHVSFENFYKVSYYSNTGSIRDDSYWTTRKNSLELKANFTQENYPWIGTDKKIFLCVKVISSNPELTRQRKIFLSVPIHG
jgi:hypothetical protein